MFEHDGYREDFEHIEIVRTAHTDNNGGCLSPTIILNQLTMANRGETGSDDEVYSINKNSIEKTFIFYIILTALRYGNL